MHSAFEIVSLIPAVVVRLLSVYGKTVFSCDTCVVECVAYEMNCKMMIKCGVENGNKNLNLFFVNMRKIT